MTFVPRLDTFPAVVALSAGYVSVVGVTPVATTEELVIIVDRRLSRRTVTSGLGALAGSALVGGSWAAGLAVPAAAETRTAAQSGAAARAGAQTGLWRDRATSSWSALQRYFLVPDGTGLYRETYPSAAGDNPYSYEWPFSQAHVASLDLATMQGAPAIYRRFLRTHDRAQQHYWTKASTTGLPGFDSYVGAPLGGGGDLFYDDNEWVGLLDVQRWLTDHDRDALVEAEKIFRLVVSGWDHDTSHPAPGGVFWTQASWSTSRNTVSNMPGAELGLRLHQITGERHYLDWSIRMYEWTNRYLQRDDGLYHDNLGLTGTVDETIWTYNQGVPIGVNTLLALNASKASQRRRYLAEAERIADAAHSYYAVDDKLAGQPPFFNSIYFKNLLLLESVTGGTTHLRRMQAWADQVWQQRRDADTGLFHFDDDSDTVAMIEQAAMVQTFAVLAWPAAKHRLLY